MVTLSGLLLVAVLTALEVTVPSAAPNLLWYVAAGLIAAGLTWRALRGDHALGWRATALVGVAGGLGGGVAAQVAGVGPVLAPLFAAAGAALLLAALGNLLRAHRERPARARRPAPVTSARARQVRRAGGGRPTTGRIG